ncbi:DUSAM domain-containing protein [Chromobacterium subtsugae]|uniref:DUSAM domain-containing protein n=1 Tax=Chromobacterium subtsugae TaxID=251747 RepID=A0ABS7FJL3_9NEIS|nr:MULTISPECIES: DUF4239 domain-containing protein [Chromobacterium]KUM03623.1 hypothetical protein Cv017_18695 [Chromobacterium subtsugae]KZE85390.1 hypothetical protein AWB61_19240 [Chromobacterium sp. F49]MBW7569185.1 DUF4239 domain-containing protein [Chromobacterium subtsugae]MBW8290268.1 DUSAM domain-containing protein [Chromobacterium subtsugae]WSE92320.1 DUF4239 domain-containing protein [Chromobacterium subtsugae]
MNPMLLQFISMPSAVQIAAWAATGCTLSIAIYFLMRTFIPHHITEQQSDEVGVIIAVVGIFYGLIIAALLVRAITHFDNSVEVAEREANQTNALYRLSAQGLPQITPRIGLGLQRYLMDVINKEWQLQQKGEDVPVASSALGQLSRILASVSPSNSKEMEYLRQAQNQLNDLYISRHSRLFNQSMTIPLEIWSICLIGEILLIFFAWMMHVPSKGIHFFLTCAMASSISIVLAIILIYDTPFYGDISVSPEPYQKALQAIATGRLDN